MDAGRSNNSNSLERASSRFKGASFDRYAALRKLAKPLFVICIVWLCFTLSAIFLARNTIILLHTYLLVGSVLSLVAGSFILFAGYMSSASHRKTFGLIYALTGCYMMFAAKMFLTAVMAMTGHNLAWQEKHTSWCYTMALWGQIFFMTSLGYTAVVILDILFILVNPMYYARNKDTVRCDYHVAVWLLALCSCVPAMAANMIGLNAHGTCWFKGDYGWSAWSFDGLFTLFALGSIIYLLYSATNEASMSNAAAAAVLHQSVLIAICFILSWIWNFTFHALLIAHLPVPYWLNATQIFWLGGVGFNNALIWFPFIQKAVEKAASGNTFRLRFPSSNDSNGRMDRYTVPRIADPSEEASTNPKKGFSIISTSKQIYPSFPETHL